MKGKFSFYLSEKLVKLLHNIMIYFCRQMNKKAKNHTGKKAVWVLNDLWTGLSN